VTHSELANWLLAKEIGIGADTPGMLAAAARVCNRLFRRLSSLVSPAAADDEVRQSKVLAWMFDAASGVDLRDLFISMLRACDAPNVLDRRTTTVSEQSSPGRGPLWTLRSAQGACPSA
jgi:hypothetical protein